MHCDVAAGRRFAARHESRSRVFGEFVVIGASCDNVSLVVVVGRHVIDNDDDSIVDRFSGEFVTDVDVAVVTLRSRFVASAKICSRCD